MTVAKRTKMCAECPWRKTSSPGWLGVSTAQDFVVTNDRAEGDMPCHMQVDYSNPNWKDTLPEAPTCVGGVQFNANTCKLPRDPAMREAQRRYGPNDEVFSSWQEFLAHHDNDLNRRYAEGTKEMGQ